MTTGVSAKTTRNLFSSAIFTMVSVTDLFVLTLVCHIQALHGVTRRRRNVVVDHNRTWPNGLMFYQLNGFTNTEEFQIRSAMKEIEAHSCIRFHVRSSIRRKYKNINKSKVCVTEIGFKNTTDDYPLHLGPDCMEHGELLSMLLKTVGVFPETVRADRDEYIEINFQDENSRQQFEIPKDEIDHLNTEYDYSSIMHETSRPGYYDIIAKQKPHGVIGLNIGLSKLDKYRINELYNCNVGLRSNSQNYYNVMPQPNQVIPFAFRPCRDSSQFVCRQQTLDCHTVKGKTTCPNKCNLCDSESRYVALSDQPDVVGSEVEERLAPAPCVDLFPICLQVFHYCQFSDSEVVYVKNSIYYRGLINKVCRKTCGVCESYIRLKLSPTKHYRTPRVPRGQCTNILPDCHLFEKMCNVDHHFIIHEHGSNYVKGRMRRLCKKQCNQCDSSLPHQQLTSNMVLINLLNSLRDGSMMCLDEDKDDILCSQRRGLCHQPNSYISLRTYTRYQDELYVDSVEIMNFRDYCPRTCGNCQSTLLRLPRYFSVSRLI